MQGAKWDDVLLKTFGNTSATFIVVTLPGVNTSASCLYITLLGQYMSNFSNMDPL